MLFVDRDEAELRERRGLLHERVRADHQHGLVGRDALGDCLPLARGQAAGEHQWRDTNGLEQLRHRAPVLFREQLRWNHDRRLILIL